MCSIVDVLDHSKLEVPLSMPTIPLYATGRICPGSRIATNEGDSSVGYIRSGSELTLGVVANIYDHA